MLTEEQYLLTCAAEECVEMAHRISKAIRFGLNEVQPGQPLNNAERLLDEYKQLCATMHILEQDGHLPSFDFTFADIDARRERIGKFMDYSRERGVLETV